MDYDELVRFARYLNKIKAVYADVSGHSVLIDGTIYRSEVEEFNWHESQVKQGHGQG